MTDHDLPGTWTFQGAQRHDGRDAWRWTAPDGQALLVVPSCALAPGKPTPMALVGYNAETYHSDGRIRVRYTPTTLIARLHLPYPAPDAVPGLLADLLAAQRPEATQGAYDALTAAAEAWCLATMSTWTGGRHISARATLDPGDASWVLEVTIGGQLGTAQEARPARHRLHLLPPHQPPPRPPLPGGPGTAKDLARPDGRRHLGQGRPSAPERRLRGRRLGSEVGAAAPVPPLPRQADAMGTMIPDDTWTLSPVSTTKDGLLQRVLSAPDGRTMLRLSANPAAKSPAPIRFLAASYTVSAVGGTLVPETRWSDLSLQAWGPPEIVADDGRLRAFVAAVFAGQAAQEADRALLAAVLSAWGHGRARSSWRGGEMQVSAEGDLRDGRYALVLKRHKGVRETVARGSISMPPALRDALCTRGSLLRASVPIQVVLPGEALSAHVRLSHETEVLEPLRRALQAQAEGSGSDLAPLLAPTLKRLLSQLRV